MVKFKVGPSVRWVNISLSWYGAYNQISKSFRYHIFTAYDLDSSFHILVQNALSDAFHILTAAQQDFSFDIFNTSSANFSYDLQGIYKLISDFNYDLKNGLDQDIAYHILTQRLTSFLYKLFGDTESARLALLEVKPSSFTFSANENLFNFGN